MLFSLDSAVVLRSCHRSSPLEDNGSRTCRVCKIVQLENAPAAALLVKLLSMYLRVIDQAGNKTDFESELIPRIGGRFILTYKTGNDAMREHYFRVLDVPYRLDNKPENQVAILLSEEETNPKFWPS